MLLVNPYIMLSLVVEAFRVHLSDAELLQLLIGEEVVLSCAFLPPAEETLLNPADFWCFRLMTMC